MVALVLIFCHYFLLFLSGCPGVNVSLVIVVSCFKWLPWCSGSHGTVCDREQWITPRHTRAGEKEAESFQIVLSQVLRIHGNLSKSFFHWKVRLLLGAAIGGLFGIAYLVSKKVTKQPTKGRYETKSKSFKMSGIYISLNLFGWDSPV